jgi:hypothetical protein
MFITINQNNSMPSFAARLENAVYKREDQTGINAIIKMLSKAFVVLACVAVAFGKLILRGLV